MALKISLLAVLLLAMALPMYAAIRALRVNGKMFHEAWATTPPRSKRIQIAAVVIWFVTLGIAFGVGYAITGNVLVAAGSAVGWAIPLAVVGPFIGFGIGKPVAGRRGQQSRSGAQ